ncbi:hypothetical protein JCM9533A_63780 [Catenuloplanes niger JCM 9533]|uniref:Uncharacterized protein n=1 Tax=Catenuloplanes niger TaxID=587534 RepID=A0AAE4CTZ4_9ACTN|nr:hypothetical protein [Catenuloplanes niger]
MKICRSGCFADLLGEGLDLGADRGDGGEVGASDARESLAVVAAGAGGGAGDPGVQDGWVGAAAVTDACQPRGQAFRREPVDCVLAGESGQEPQTDRGVEVAEQVDDGGQRGLQMGAQLVGRSDTMCDQVFAGPAQFAQRDGGLAVEQQRCQPAPVGAHGVGKDVGVESVVLVPGRAVTPSQGFDLRRWDHQDGAAGGQQRVDHRPVAAFDADLVDTVPVQDGVQPVQTCFGMGDAEPFDRIAVAVDDADGVVVFGPVDTGGDHSPLAGGVLHTHCCLSAAQPVGKHLAVPGHHSRLLIERRSHTHSPVADRGVPGRRASQNSCWTSKVERAGRWPDSHRCTRTNISSSETRVHQ